MTAYFDFASSTWNEWAMDVAFKSLLILSLATAVACALKRGNSTAAARHLSWSLALMVLLALPLVAALSPAWSVPIFSGWLARSWAAASPQAKPADNQFVFAWSNAKLAEFDEPDAGRTRTDGSNINPAESTASLLPVAASATRLPNAIFAGWLIGVGLALMPLSLGIVSLWYVRRRARAVSSGPLFESLVEVTAATGVKHQPQLFVSDARDMPMTWGFFRARILLPESAHAWTKERLQVVLMHEFAHIRRRDCCVQALAQLARALYWWNPLAWFAERCIRNEQEQACDDEVLRHGCRPSLYAEHLLAILAQHRRPSFAAALGLAMARPTKLERRLKSILHFSPDRCGVSRRRFSLAITVAVLLLVAASSIQVRLASAEEGNPKEAPKTSASAADHLKAWDELRTRIAEQYVGTINERDMRQAVIKGMLQSLGDPDSDFITNDMLAEMEKQIGGSIIGIGVQLETHEQQTRVVTPLPESPAMEAGIQPGDVILQIDGQSVEKLPLMDVVKRVAGQAGTKVRLRVRREGAEKELEATRGPVKLASVIGYQRGADSRWNYLLTNNPKLGYVQITQFNTRTPDELRAALESLKSQQFEGLILDLRFCPGGLLDSAVQSAKQFLSSGTIVSLHSRSGDPITIKADSPAIFGDTPLVVLVNNYTASAAEVVAGALQDNQRAIVVGTRTIGKGSVQTLIKLADSSGAIRLTTSSYHLPSGRDIDRKPDQTVWGVSANEGYFVPMSEAQLRALTQHRLARDVVSKTARKEATITPEWLEQQAADPQLAAALKTLTGRVKTGSFTKVSELSTAQVDQFIKRSEIEQKRAKIVQSLEAVDRELADLGK